MAIRLVRAHCQTCIQKQHSTIGPWCKEAAVFGWRGERGVVCAEGDVDVLERGWCGDWGADGEAEAMCLIKVVVGILAEDDRFDGWKGSMSGPGSGRT